MIQNKNRPHQSDRRTVNPIRPLAFECLENRKLLAAVDGGLGGSLCEQLGGCPSPVTPPDAPPTVIIDPSPVIVDTAPPKCTANLVAGTLTITGDGHRNNIRLKDSAAGTISGKCDRVRLRFNNVTDVVLNTLGGNDTVSYTRMGLIQSARNFTFDLGDGDDTLSASGLSVGGVGAPNVVVNVAGGLGRDIIDLTGLGSTNGTLVVFVRAGDGDDQVTANSQSPLGGSVFPTIEGEDGNDTMQATGPQSLSGGIWSPQLQGGNGDDTLILTGLGSGVIFAGPGQLDRCSQATLVLDCEVSLN